MNQIPPMPKSTPLDVEFFTYCMVATIQSFLIQNGKDWDDLVSIEGFGIEKVTKMRTHAHIINITDLASIANHFNITVGEIMDQHKLLMDNWSMLECFRDRNIVRPESADYGKYFRSRIEKIMEEFNK